MSETDTARRGAPPLPRSISELRREHHQTRLRAMSFDGAASPSVALRALARGEEPEVPHGRGSAW